MKAYVCDKCGGHMLSTFLEDDEMPSGWAKLTIESRDRGIYSIAHVCEACMRSGPLPITYDAGRFFLPHKKVSP